MTGLLHVMLGGLLLLLALVLALTVATAAWIELRQQKKQYKRRKYPPT